MKMNLAKKISLLSLVIVIFTTLSKFIVYFISGSLTSYSEAWHSLSDLATTIIVFIAIKLSYNKENKKIELIPAIIIALALGYIGFAILYEVIYYKSVEIRYPLISGVIFLVFSLFSYFLYKIQTITGEKEKSIALIADGKHSKTDMLTASLTGISLILFSQGIDLERYISFFLALIILLFSLELSINTISIYRKDSERLDTLVKRIDLKKLISNNPKFKKIFIVVIVILSFILLIQQSTYSVPTGGNAIHLRFGKIVKISSSGAYFKIPIIDKIKFKDSMRIKTIGIGNIAKGSLIWSKKHGISNQMITGDNNFIVPYIIVQYSIDDYSSYYLNNKEPKKLLKDIIDEEIILYFSSDSFENIILNKRGNWNKYIVSNIEKRIKSLKLGIKIVNLTIKDIHPPKNVAESFEKLIATTQNQVTVSIAAKNYKNLTLNNARVTAYKQIIVAQIRKNDKIKMVEANKKKDMLLFEIFTKYKKIIKRLKYLDMVSNAIYNNNKVIVDKRAKIDLWLNKPLKIEKLREN